MNNLLKEGPLLNEEGNLDEAGFAFDLVKEYKRSDIKVRKTRIKEWDYYFVGDSKRGVAFTIDDNGYMGLASVSILDFEKQSFITKSSMSAFPLGKIGLPASSKEGKSEWKDKNYELSFACKDKKRVLDVNVLDYNDHLPFKAHIELMENNEGTMVIATPFLKKRHFYYNQKINCQICQGFYEYGDERYEFKEENTRGVLDWGRGVWTYSNTWYWASLSQVQDGHEIGFNLGYGFGDTSKASENMLFYDQKAYKLDDVSFNIPQDENGKYLFMNEWTFTSSNKDIDLKFVPLLDRHDDTDVLIIKSLQHQVFGKFSGTIKVDGLSVKIKDLIGFAERVHNCW